MGSGALGSQGLQGRCRRPNSRAAETRAGMARGTERRDGRQGRKQSVATSHRALESYSRSNGVSVNDFFNPLGRLS